MSKLRIYMDADMLESYSSYSEAADSFLDQISIENMSLDATIQVNFEISDTDVFSDHAMEAISDTVKNMASKAKSNFVTYAKKLINFLFGWLINFFKGTVNVKKAIASSFEKARTYLKKLNELESKARGSSKEETIEITDFGNCVVVGLTIIQAIISSSSKIGEGLKNASNSTNGTSTDKGDNKNAGSTRAFKMLNVLLNDLQDLYAIVGSINITNVKELIAGLKTTQYNVHTWMGKFKSEANTLKTSKHKESAQDEVSKIQSGEEEMVDDQNKSDNFDRRIKGGATDKLESSYKAKLEQTAKYMSEPNKAEMSLMTAYDELKTKLNLFISISKANKWDLEKNIAAAEKIRRGLEKEVSNMEVSDVNEKTISDLLQRIIKLGNNLGQIQRSAGTVTKEIVKCIDGMTVDVAKLGSKLIKIGG